MIASALGTRVPDESPLALTLPTRTGSYGEAYSIPMTAKEFAFVDEGSYFTAISPTSGTGITGTVITTLDTTHPILYLYNGTTKRLYPQQLSIVINTASTTGTTGGWKLTPIVDVGNLYTSGGTALTVANDYIGSTAVDASLVVAVAGALTATASTASAIQHGDITFRYSTADIVQDHYDVFFGATSSNGGSSSKPATLCDISRIAAPMVIPPGYCLKFYQWRATQNGASVFQVRMGFVLR